MHFTSIIAASAAVTGALAGYYAEEPSYTTVDDKVYTSVKTCTDKTYEATSAPVYEATEVPYGSETTSAPVYEAEPTYAAEVTYTSYEKVTITSCADYVVSCPAETYTSTAYSVSTCTGKPSYYVPPVNSTAYYVPEPEYPTETPVEYPTETAYPTEYPTETDYVHSTLTSTYCPGGSSTPVATPTYVPETPTYVPETPTYAPCPGGYDCPTPPSNETTPTYSPPPSYTGAASANAVSFGVAAIAGLAALFIAA